MLSDCIHCGEPFNFSEAQASKIEGALAKLQPGKFLKFNCPHCGKAVEIRAEGNGDEPRKDAVVAGAATAGGKGEGGKPVPPDTGWLDGGQFEKKGVVEDVPLALILIKDNELKTTVADAFVGKSYRPVFAQSVERAIESMRFVQYAAVVFQPGFEGKPFADSVLHKYMRDMEMSRRRTIYYMLIGPEFNTLYDLEALTNSANLVVNEKDGPHIDAVLNKSLQDYEELFGPLLAVMKEQGKM